MDDPPNSASSLHALVALALQEKTMMQTSSLFDEGNPVVKTSLVSAAKEKIEIAQNVLSHQNKQDEARFPSPVFNTIEELKQMHLDVILRTSGGRVGSTTGTTTSEMIRIICMCFFNWDELTRDMRNEHRPDPTPPMWTHLSDFRRAFSTKIWKETYESDGQSIYCPSKKSAQKGLGQKYFVKTRVMEWCKYSQHPYSNLLLTIIEHPEFDKTMIEMRRKWHIMARASTAKPKKRMTSSVAPDSDTKRAKFVHPSDIHYGID